MKILSDANQLIICNISRAGSAVLLIVLRLVLALARRNSNGNHRWMRVCSSDYLVASGMSMYVIIPTYKWRAHVSRTISQIQLLNKDYSLTDLTRHSWTRQSAVKPGRSRSAPGRRRALGIFGRCSKLVLFFNFAPLDWLSAPPRGVSRVWCQVSWVQPPDVMFAESTMECKILRRLGYKLCSDNSLLAI